MRPLAWWLLLISGIFSLSVGLSNTFVNIFVWKVDKSYSAIALYNLCVYAVMPIAFILACFVSKRLHTGWALRIGIFFHAGFYAVTLFIGERAAAVPYLLGMLMGLSAGFYWFAFNTLSLQYTERGERDRFFGLNGVLSAVSGMVAPPAAGYLITAEDRFGGLSGYHIIFGVSFILFALATLVSFKLYATPLDARLRLGRAFRALRKRPWRMVIVGCAVYGLREGVFIFLIGLLLYIATGSELRLGEFLFLQSVLSFVSFFLVGRYTKPHNRLKVLGMGACGMAGAALLFLLPISAKSIVWYGCVVAIALPLFLTPLQGFIFDGITSVEHEEKAHAEHVIVREIFGNAGRVTGIGIFLY